MYLYYHDLIFSQVGFKIYFYFHDVRKLIDKYMYIMRYYVYNCVIWAMQIEYNIREYRWRIYYKTILKKFLTLFLNILFKGLRNFSFRNIDNTVNSSWYRSLKLCGNTNIGIQEIHFSRISIFLFVYSRWT